MIKTTSATVAVLFACQWLAVSTAEAQVPWYRGGYGYPYFSSTPLEGAQRGLADVIRSRGMAYEAGTRGLVNYQEAVSRYIDNRKKWQYTYWELKRQGQAERRAQYEEKREAWKAYLATKDSSYPPRLSPSELDPSTGRINWPAPLMGDDYAELRREIQELLLLRAQTGATGRYGDQLYDKAREMQAELKRHIREMPAPSYIAARNFLESLAYEGLQPIVG